MSSKETRGTSSNLSLSPKSPVWAALEWENVLDPFLRYMTLPLGRCSYD